MVKYGRKTRSKLSYFYSLQLRKLAKSLVFGENPQNLCQRLRQCLHRSVKYSVYTENKSVKKPENVINLIRAQKCGNIVLF